MFLLEPVKASIHVNRDMCVQLQEGLISGLSGPAAFKMLLADITDYFDRAPRGATLETL